jgi:hypothetical protein
MLIGPKFWGKPLQKDLWAIFCLVWAFCWETENISHHSLLMQVTHKVETSNPLQQLSSIPKVFFSEAELRIVVWSTKWKPHPILCTMYVTLCSISTQEFLQIDIGDIGICVAGHHFMFGAAQQTTPCLFSITFLQSTILIHLFCLSDDNSAQTQPFLWQNPQVASVRLSRSWNRDPN